MKSIGTAVGYEPGSIQVNARVTLLSFPTLHLPTAVWLRFTQIHPYMRRRSVTELDGTDGKAEIFHTLNSTINNALNAVQQL